jgi:hypothetical protein
VCESGRLYSERGNLFDRGIRRLLVASFGGGAEIHARSSDGNRKEFGNGGILAPILRSGSETPEISRSIHTDANDPEFAALAGWQATGHVRRRASASRQLVHAHTRSWLEGTRKTHAASSRVDHGGVAVFGQHGERFEAGKAQRNLCPHSRPVPPVGCGHRILTRAHGDSILAPRARKCLRAATPK